MTERSSQAGSPKHRGLRGFVRDNGLGLFFTAAFVLALVGQAFAGHADFNNQMAADQLQQISLGEYVPGGPRSADGGVRCTRTRCCW